MTKRPFSLSTRIAITVLITALLLTAAMTAGLAMGSSGSGLSAVWQTLFGDGGQQH